jgi:peroxiredoxin
VDVSKASAGKTIALFALPGAFTPTCSAKHVPGYVEKFDELKAAGVDEIWCVSVNDAFVMGAWARDQKTGAKVRMLGDGDAAGAGEVLIQSASAMKCIADSVQLALDNGLKIQISTFR